MKILLSVISFSFLLLNQAAMSTHCGKGFATHALVIVADIHPVPENIDECMEFLDEMLSDEEKKEFKSSDPMYHHSLGQHIRNKWRLWKRSKLYEYFYGLGLRHPDEMSGIILNCYSRHLNGKDIDFKGELERSQLTPTPQLMIPDSLQNR